MTVTLTFLSRLSVAQQPCCAIPKISIMGHVHQITEHNRISFYNCHGFFPTCSLPSLFLLHYIYYYYFAYKKGKVFEVLLLFFFCATAPSNVLSLFSHYFLTEKNIFSSYTYGVMKGVSLAILLCSEYINTRAQPDKSNE